MLAERGCRIRGGEFALVVKMGKACVETKRKGPARTCHPLMDLLFLFS